MFCNDQYKDHLLSLINLDLNNKLLMNMNNTVHIFVFCGTEKMIREVMKIYENIINNHLDLFRILKYVENLFKIVLFQIYKLLRN